MVKKLTTLTNAVFTAIITLIIITIIFNYSSVLIPEAQRAGDNINQSVGVLGGLFVGSSIIFLIVVVACFVLVMRIILTQRK